MNVSTRLNFCRCMQWARLVGVQRQVLNRHWQCYQVRICSSEIILNYCRSVNNSCKSDYRKIPKISPSKYKPPQTGNVKNPPLNRPSKYKPPPPPGLVIGNKCFIYPLPKRSLLKSYPISEPGGRVIKSLDLGSVGFLRRLETFLLFSPKRTIP